MTIIAWASGTALVWIWIFFFYQAARRKQKRAKLVRELEFWRSQIEAYRAQQAKFPDMFEDYEAEIAEIKVRVAALLKELE